MAVIFNGYLAFAITIFMPLLTYNCFIDNLHHIKQNIPNFSTHFVRFRTLAVQNCNGRKLETSKFKRKRYIQTIERIRGNVR